jgi:hypothetical protein
VHRVHEYTAEETERLTRRRRRWRRPRGRAPLTLLLSPLTGGEGSGARTHRPESEPQR